MMLKSSLSQARVLGVGATASDTDPLDPADPSDPVKLFRAIFVHSVAALGPAQHSRYTNSGLIALAVPTGNGRCC